MIEFSSKKGIEGKQGKLDFKAMGWKRKFVIQCHFLGWSHVQLGFHVCLSIPNMELHVPFGFVRIGWVWRS